LESRFVLKGKRKFVIVVLLSIKSHQLIPSFEAFYITARIIDLVLVESILVKTGQCMFRTLDRIVGRKTR